MATPLNPQQIVNGAACFTCIPNNLREAVLLYLLNQVFANSSAGSAGALRVFNIPNGVSQFTVAGLALSAVPTAVVGSVGHAAGDLNLFATIVTTSITAAGFTADLSGITDNGNYKFYYTIQ